ncbi:MAG: TrpB-like pyridoxal phosphate-dependent enzyme [Mobiluncus porci]|uniref:TrpB-like pyridoxal phosphate-dependent enzyme n=1 Tax=Mobiluncus TaxID=2050 RepID=UPI0023F1A1D2|nr:MULTISPECIES: TrpB-like pyridoxal phosphate-dependent enzyme [Mobiluncus]MCI6584243.1 TrpB-like pyridoxal phosphate-dependent enzyme [Mobiluncus sp.]MDD7540756.1 TrpB-like pyridoxal phosphate-dependent enzyme [Mobiluncus porci]MDY5748318.1 TrpB-like pyridoxal phosphate-dependent enzyme [Mobiluncus porci]
MTESNLEVQGYIVPSEVPTHWYNIMADFPEPMAPLLNPATKEPATKEDMAPIFASHLIDQELSTERYLEIPEPVREIYSQWRPSPLIRAARLEKMLGTKARVYYKYEGVSPTGSHKPNSSVAQAYYNKLEGMDKVTTETGAGQWGASLAMACAMFDLGCEVYQVRASFESKPYRRMQMHTYGADCYASPSDRTESGRAMREQFPDTSGSLGMAISEAVEVAVKNPKAHYALGSVLNQVLIHQSVIGLEAMAQLEAAGEGTADVVFGCAGGGSNLGGLALPFMGRELRGEAPRRTRIVAVEPKSCPSMTEGEFRYDFGDTAQTTPLMKMYTLGTAFVPDPIHAGGLRYHGMAPMVSHAYHLGLMEAISRPQDQTFAAGREFARAEGIIPAPESCHAICGAMDYLKSGEAKDGEVVLIGISGNGVLDLPSYDAVLGD